MEKYTSLLKFNNTENQCITVAETGQKAWLSRSVAVVGLIRINNKYLMVKRGPKCPDEVGKWVLPCGYLDNDENLSEAMMRECKEETSFNLLAMMSDLTDVTLNSFACDPFDESEFGMPYGDGRAVFTRSNPKRDKKQNISEYMAIVGCLAAELPVPDINQLNPDETEAVAWMSMEQINHLDAHGCIGFNHARQIIRFHAKLNAGFTL